MKVPRIKQSRRMGCGVTALQMVFAYYNKSVGEQDIIRDIGGLKSYGTTNQSLFGR
ncbi:MAG: C39 family peptidase [Candidatus Nanoarchaeia archaeon]